VQEELERQESGLEEEDEDDEEEEQDGRSVQRAQSSVLLSPTQPVRSSLLRVDIRKGTALNDSSMSSSYETFRSNCPQVDIKSSLRSQ